MKKTLFTALAAAALAAGVYVWWQARAPAQVGLLTLYGNVDIRQISLAFDGTGRVQSLAVDEGAQVQPGQLLGQLDTRTLALQAEQAQAQIEVQQQTLLKLQNGARPQEVAQAKSRVAAAQADAARARQDYARTRQLYADSRGQAISAQTLDNAKASAQAADAKVQEAREALRLTELGPRSEEIAAAQAQLKAAQAQLALLQHQITQGELRAPTAAVVRARLLEPGDMANPQRPAYTLALTAPKWVRVYVAEPDLGKIRPGMPARVSTDSQPDQPLQGRVGYIASVAEFTPKSVQTTDLRTSLVYEVRVQVQDGADTLRLGQPATVQIDTTAAAENAAGGQEAQGAQKVQGIEGAPEAQAAPETQKAAQGAQGAASAQGTEAAPATPAAAAAAAKAPTTPLTPAAPKAGAAPTARATIPGTPPPAGGQASAPAAFAAFAAPAPAAAALPHPGPAPRPAQPARTARATHAAHILQATQAAPAQATSLVPSKTIAANPCGMREDGVFSSSPLAATPTPAVKAAATPTATPFAAGASRFGAPCPTFAAVQATQAPLRLAAIRTAAAMAAAPQASAPAPSHTLAAATYGATGAGPRPHSPFPAALAPAAPAALASPVQIFSPPLAQPLAPLAQAHRVAAPAATAGAPALAAAISLVPSKTIAATPCGMCEDGVFSSSPSTATRPARQACATA